MSNIPNDDEPKIENSKVKLLESKIISVNGKSSDLFNSQDGFYIEFKKDQIEIEFNAAYFINEIRLSVEKLEIQKLNISGHDIFNDEKREFKNISTGVDANAIHIKIDTVIKKIKLKYNKGFFDWEKVKINGIQVFGIPIQEIEGYLEPLSKIETFEKESLAKIEAEKLGLETDKKKALASLQESNTQLTTIKNSIETFKAQEAEQIKLAQQAEKEREQKVEELSIKVTEIKNNESKINDLTTVKANLETQNRSLDSANVNLKDEILKNQNEIRALKKTFSLYSNEYASFYKQANWYIVFYSVFAIVPILIISILFWKLLDGSIELSTLYKKEKDLDLMTIVFTRIPFVAVTSIIITGAYKIFKLLALKIIDIQNQKMNLSKLAILAQDVVNLSAEGLKLSDEQIHDVNIYLRMQLIKSHMINELGNEYKYKARDEKILDEVLTKLPVPTLEPESIASTTKPK